jgi:hypothetical protein
VKGRGESRWELKGGEWLAWAGTTKEAIERCPVPLEECRGGSCGVLGGVGGDAGLGGEVGDGGTIL